MPVDQVPEPPLYLEAEVLGHDSLQLSFDWPKRDGGKSIVEFVVVYDTVSSFSSANEMSIPVTVPTRIPNSSDRFTFDLIPSPQLNAGVITFIK